MAHIPPSVNTFFRGKRVYRTIDTKTRSGIYRRCGFTLLWTLIALVWVGFDAKHGDVGVFGTIPNAAIFLLFIGMTFLRSLFGVILPQGYFNLFIAPRVLKAMPLLQKFKITFSRASFTAVALFFAYACAQIGGDKTPVLYWATFSTIAYLSIFIPFTNEFVYELCLIGYTGMLEDWGSVKPAGHSDPFPEVSPLDELTYDPAYSGCAGNIFTK